LKNQRFVIPNPLCLSGEESKQKSRKLVQVASRKDLNGFWNFDFDSSSGVQSAHPVEMTIFSQESSAHKDEDPDQNENRYSRFFHPDTVSDP
jgi:hypothetical protein